MLQPADQQQLLSLVGLWRPSVPLGMLPLLGLLLLASLHSAVDTAVHRLAREQAYLGQVGAETWACVARMLGRAKHVAQAGRIAPSLCGAKQAAVTPATPLQLGWWRANVALTGAHLRLPAGGGLWPHPAGCTGAQKLVARELATSAGNTRLASMQYMAGCLRGCLSTQHMWRCPTLQGYLLVLFDCPISLLSLAWLLVLALAFVYQPLPGRWQEQDGGSSVLQAAMQGLVQRLGAWCSNLPGAVWLSGCALARCHGQPTRPAAFRCSLQAGSACPCGTRRRGAGPRCCSWLPLQLPTLLPRRCCRQSLRQTRLAGSLCRRVCWILCSQWWG